MAGNQWIRRPDGSVFDRYANSQYVAAMAGMRAPVQPDAHSYHYSQTRNPMPSIPASMQQPFLDSMQPSTSSQSAYTSTPRTLANRVHAQTPAGTHADVPHANADELTPTMASDAQGMKRKPTAKRTKAGVSARAKNGAAVDNPKAFEWTVEVVRQMFEAHAETQNTATQKHIWLLTAQRMGMSASAYEKVRKRSGQTDSPTDEHGQIVKKPSFYEECHGQWQDNKYMDLAAFSDSKAFKKMDMLYFGSDGEEEGDLFDSGS
eukprot:jgi/Chlat1/6875/Chrsp51S06571